MIAIYILLNVKISQSFLSPKIKIYLFIYLILLYIHELKYESPKEINHSFTLNYYLDFLFKCIAELM